jgi:hypothetical protein
MHPPHVVPQPDQPVTKPRLDRPRRHPEQLGDLPVGVAAVVGEHHRLALQVGEGVKAPADALALQGGLDLLGHLVIGASLVAPAGQVVAPGRALGRADPVDRPAVGAGHDPGPGRAPARVEPRRRPPQLDEHLLGHLLRLRRVADHLTDQPEHRGRDPLVELGKGLLVSAGDQGQQPFQGVVTGRAVRRGLGRPVRELTPGPGQCHARPSLGANGH